MSKSFEILKLLIQNLSPMDFELNNESDYNVKLTIVSLSNYRTVIDANLCETSLNLFTIKDPNNDKERLIASRKIYDKYQL